MRIPGNAPGPAEQSRSSTGVSKSADRIPERHVSSEDVRPQAPGWVGEQREWGGMKRLSKSITWKKQDDTGRRNSIGKTQKPFPYPILYYFVCLVVLLFCFFQVAEKRCFFFQEELVSSLRNELKALRDTTDEKIAKLNEREDQTKVNTLLVLRPQRKKITKNCFSFQIYNTLWNLSIF